MAYTGSVDLISGIRPKNGGSFPLVSAHDVYVSDDVRLDDALNDFVQVTWRELKLLRDLRRLVPGRLYRITDYVATTNGGGDAHARSANHPFDIIVSADTPDMLNEHARAIIHEGDLPDDIVDGSTRTKYFAACNLAAWDVWYCLDNDTARFVWADTSTSEDPSTGDQVPNGRGVVYRLVDEFMNDVPYDFKGLQFVPYGDSDESPYRYTFDSGSESGGTDLSLAGGNTSIIVEQNVIGVRMVAGRRNLNRIVMTGTHCYRNVFGADCAAISTGGSFRLNSLGSSCSQCVFGENCLNNTLSADTTSCTFGDNCLCNSLMQWCESCRFGDGFAYNSVGIRCAYAVFGSYCVCNRIGNFCNNLTAGDYLAASTFGDWCHDIRLGTQSAVQSFFWYITFQDGVHHVCLNSTGTRSIAVPYRNVELKSGINNGSTYKVITDPNVGQTFHTTFKPDDSQEVTV